MTSVTLHCWCAHVIFLLMSNIGPFARREDSDAFSHDKDAAPQAQESVKVDAADSESRARSFTHKIAKRNALSDQAANFCKIEERRESFRNPKHFR